MLVMYLALHAGEGFIVFGGVLDAQPIAEMASLASTLMHLQLPDLHSSLT